MVRPKILMGIIAVCLSFSFFISVLNPSGAWSGPLEEGEQLEKQHLYYEAARAYENIDDPELREQKMNHLVDSWDGINGEIMRAQEHLAKNPNSAEAHYELGDKYHRKGRALINYERQNLRNYPEAIITEEKNFFLNAAFNEGKSALAMKEDYPAAHLLLGKVYLALDRKSEAVQEINRVVSIDPGYKEGYWALTQIYLEAKAYDQAEASLLKLIEVDPKNGSAHSLLGTVYLEQAEPRKAISAFNKAVQANSSDKESVALLAKAYNIYGTDLAKQEKYDDAVAVFQKAFQLKPLKEYYDHMQLALKKQEEQKLTAPVKPVKEETPTKKYKKSSKRHYKKKKGKAQPHYAHPTMSKKGAKSKAAQPGITTQPLMPGASTPGQSSGQPELEKPISTQPSAGAPETAGQSNRQPPVDQTPTPMPATTTQPQPEQPPQPPQGEQKR
jgi:tetratricopeptide (TPR) repeat protein